LGSLAELVEPVIKLLPKLGFIHCLNNLANDCKQEKLDNLVVSNQNVTFMEK
jgi:hypothetical protein